MAPIGIISGTVLHGASVFKGLRKEHVVNEFGRVTVWVSREIAHISRHDRDPAITSCPTSSTTRPTSRP